MNVLFLCLSRIWDIQEKGIYTDLLREFMKNSDTVYVVTPVERRFHEISSVINQENAVILKVKTLNIQKTNVIEKGLGTIFIEWQYLNAIKRHFRDVSFDLVLYATPPITLVKPIEYIKKKCNAETYLLLKDIYPQNAIDIGMMSYHGIKGLLYNFFRKKETQLYAVSNHIGCMSQANVEYLLKHNSSVSADKVEMCPNCIAYTDLSIGEDEKTRIRMEYQLPKDKKIFIYGGNLGKPQGIPFLVECLKAEADNPRAFFLIVGDGTEYSILLDYVETQKPTHVRLLRQLPEEEYKQLVSACDVGMIFLDYRFTIPNFPSRLLSYMQVGLPVLACTDPNTDVGTIITEGEFGLWCPSNSIPDFTACVEAAIAMAQEPKAGVRAKQYLKEHFSVERGYSIIMDSVRHK